MLLGSEALAAKFSRRKFINAIGQAGLYRTLGAMGILPVPTAHARPPDLPTDAGRGKSVVILGPGIAGMTAAYPLRKAGFRCSIVESRERPGGRNWTRRCAHQITETSSV